MMQNQPPTTLFPRTVRYRLLDDKGNVRSGLVLFVSCFMASAILALVIALSVTVWSHTSGSVLTPPEPYTTQLQLRFDSNYDAISSNRLAYATALAISLAHQLNLAATQVLVIALSPGSIIADVQITAVHSDTLSDRVVTDSQVVGSSIYNVLTQNGAVNVTSLKTDVVTLCSVALCADIIASSSTGSASYSNSTNTTNINILSSSTGISSSSSSFVGNGTNSTTHN